MSSNTRSRWPTCWPTTTRSCSSSPATARRRSHAVPAARPQDGGGHGAGGRARLERRQDRVRDAHVARGRGPRPPAGKRTAPPGVRHQRGPRDVPHARGAVPGPGGRHRGGVGVELTVLGCSGSYGAQPFGACSGYLVRGGGAAVWVDCGNGTLPHLQQHARIEDLSAVVLTHQHPDHCADIYGLHVLMRYGLERGGLPVFAPECLEERLRALVDGCGDTLDWKVVGDGDGVELGCL